MACSPGTVASRCQRGVMGSTLASVAGVSWARLLWWASLPRDWLLPWMCQTRLEHTTLPHPRTAQPHHCSCIPPPAPQALFPGRYPGLQSLRTRAGVELRSVMRFIDFLSRHVSNPARFAPQLALADKLARSFGSDQGAFHMMVSEHPALQVCCDICAFTHTVRGRVVVRCAANRRRAATPWARMVQWRGCVVSSPQQTSRAAFLPPSTARGPSLQATAMALRSHARRQCWCVRS